MYWTQFLNAFYSVLAGGVLGEPESLLSQISIPLILIVTLIGLAASLLLPVLIREQFKVCKEPGCFDYAKELKLVMDLNLDPCTDFFSYVCGNFETLYPSDSSYMSLVNSRIAEIENSLLNLYRADKENYVIDRAILAFRRCIDEYRDGFEDVEPVRILARNLSLYWSLAIPTFSKIDILNILMEASLNFGLPVLLRFEFLPDVNWKKGEKLKLHLRVEYVQPIEKHHESVIEASFRAVAHNMSSLKFKCLAKRVFRTLAYFNSAVQGQFSLATDAAYVKFSNISDIFTFVEPANFLSTLNKHLPNRAHVGLDEEFVAETLAAMKRLSAFFVNTASLDLLNMIRFLALQKLVPLTTSRLTDIYGYKPSDVFQFRLRYCIKNSLAFVPRAREYILFYGLLRRKNYTIPEHITSQVKKTVPDAFGWMDKATFDNATDRLRGLRIVVGRIPELSTHDGVQKRYSFLPPLNPERPFVEWAIQARREGAQYRKTQLSNTSTVVRDVYRTMVTANAIADKVNQYVRILPGFLFPPFVFDGAPQSVNYGSLGSLTASLIAKFLDGYDVPRDATGARVSWMTNASRQKHQETLQCALAHQQTYENTGDPLEIDPLEALSGILGIRIAFAAFAKGNKSESWRATHLPFLRSEEQLFFVAYCFRLCGVVLPWSVTGTTPLNVLCNIPLMNSAEFAKAFKCAPSGKMNPEMKC